jgi:hypothetical protein
MPDFNGNDAMRLAACVPPTMPLLVVNGTAPQCYHCAWWADERCWCALPCEVTDTWRARAMQEGEFTEL